MNIYVKTILLGSVLVTSYNVQAKDWSKVDKCPSGKAACLPGISPKPSEPNLSHGRPVFDFDTDGCLASSPIVQDGTGYKTNPGTKPTGALNGQCAYRDQLLKNVDILYKKVCATDTRYCAEVYALYTVKDMYHAGTPIEGKGFAHRHDLEHVVLWTVDGKVNEVGITAHGGLTNKIVEKFPRLSEDENSRDYNKFTVVYHKDGGGNHALRASKSKEINIKRITLNTESPETPDGKWFEGHIVDVDSVNSTAYKNIVENGNWGQATLQIKSDQKIRQFLQDKRPGNWKNNKINFK